jgi:hypothetical protein
VLEHCRQRKTGAYGRRQAGGIAGSRMAWWLYKFVSVKINGLGNFLEQSKLYTSTAFGQLKSCCGGYSASYSYTFPKTGRPLI